MILADVGLFIYRVFPDVKYKTPEPLFVAVLILISAAPPGDVIYKCFPLVFDCTVTLASVAPTTLSPVEVSVCVVPVETITQLLVNEVTPVPPCATATVPVTLVALPLNVPVIV
jgi:hypothetical protein